MKATGQLIKLALKRDNSITVGQPAPMRLDCPCGQTIPIVEAPGVFEYVCIGCGHRYNYLGWLVR